MDQSQHDVAQYKPDVGFCRPADGDGQVESMQQQGDQESSGKTGGKRPRAGIMSSLQGHAKPAVRQKGAESADIASGAGHSNPGSTGAVFDFSNYHAKLNLCLLSGSMFQVNISD